MSVDDFKAKAYKSLIYDKIKKEHPELNNYDRAVEMEKLTTKEFLDTLDADVNNRIEFLKDLYQKKPPKSPKSSTESPTSTEEKHIKKNKKSSTKSSDKNSDKKSKSKKSKKNTESSVTTSDGLIDIHSSDFE
jgi:FKBP-type peptidyl-prolyl cis-trans isomerase